MSMVQSLAVAGVMLLLGFGGFSGSTLAGTPDGDTPPNEGVCDVLQGGTPGLYGLCVAYCEAQDLDIVSSKETPNRKILENYLKKMQPGDPDMPCVQIPCPCWSASEIASITIDGTAAACTPTTNTISIIDDSPLLRTAEADVNITSCLYKDLNANPPKALGFSITATEAQVCFTDIQQACENGGK